MPVSGRGKADRARPGRRQADAEIHYSGGSVRASGKLSGDLAKTEASINQNIDSRSAELSRKFDDLLTRITSPATPQEAIAEAKAAGVSFELTDADVQMLGFRRDVADVFAASDIILSVGKSALW